MFNQVGSSFKKRLVLAGLVFLAVTVVISIIYWSLSSGQKGGYLDISNLDKYTRGKPSDKDTLDYIKRSLYTTVNLNLREPVASNSVKDILVRDGAFHQEASETKSAHIVTFIVDIESLKQSYQVNYSWPYDKNRGSDNIDERAVGVLCLPRDKLVFGDFKCKDLFTEEEVAPDPIFQYLPHSTLDYSVTYDSEAERKTLVIDIKTSAGDERVDPKAAIEAYQNEARQWLDSLEGINAKDYVIHWTYSRSSLY